MCCSALDRHLQCFYFTVRSPKHRGSGGITLQKYNRHSFKEGYHQYRRFRPFAGLNEGSGFSANSNTGSYTSSDSDIEETRSKLNASLQLSESGVDYVQALHEAARKFQLAMEQHGSLRKHGWFAKSWLGVDHDSWIKPLAYQASFQSSIFYLLHFSWTIIEVKFAFLMS